MSEGCKIVNESEGNVSPSHLIATPRVPPALLVTPCAQRERFLQRTGSIFTFRFMERQRVKRSNKENIRHGWESIRIPKEGITGQRAMQEEKNTACEGYKLG